MRSRYMSCSRFRWGIVQFSLRENSDIAVETLHTESIDKIREMAAMRLVSGKVYRLWELRTLEHNFTLKLY